MEEEPGCGTPEHAITSGQCAHLQPIPESTGVCGAGEPGMSPLRLEEEVNTALNSGQTYRQVVKCSCCTLDKPGLGCL